MEGSGTQQRPTIVVEKGRERVYHEDLIMEERRLPAAQMEDAERQ